MSGNLETVCGAKEADLKELLQEQVAVDNVVRTATPNATLEERCLDFQTGKINADEVLNMKIEDTTNVVDEQRDLHGVSRNNPDMADMPLVDGDKISYEIHTRNESLDGDRHPVTGVKFEQKTVEDAVGNQVTGVFPEFDSKFNAQLSDDELQASDRDQFDECNRQLKTALESDPDLASQFTSEQLDQIQNGDTPDGCTWHHNEAKGKMQLVDMDVHATTGHTGGRSIWGGGTEFR